MFCHQFHPILIFAVFVPPQTIILHMERLMSRFLWGSDDSSPRRIWRSWERLAYPVSENGLGLRRLSEVVRAFSYMLWWKWRLGLGIWSNFLHSVTWQGSWIAPDVDVFMRTNTLVKIRDESSSLLFDNWSGQGAVVDIFELADLDGIATFNT